MKKVFLTLILAGSMFGAVAQDSEVTQFTNKNGVPVLPQAGDWGLSYSANPFFSYVGNMFNSNVNNVSPLIMAPKGLPTTITGKYFVNSGFAYRGSIGINMVSNSNREKVMDSNDSSLLKDDIQKVNSFNMNISLGIEKRMGSTRVQGFYGAEVMLGFGTGTTTSYNYANSIDPQNGTLPTTTAYNGGANIISPAERVVEDNRGGMFMIGARGFVGAEYFILPKFSLGVEYGIALGFTHMGDGTIDSEATTGTAREEYTVESAGGSNFSLLNDVSGGNISLNLYF